jgi:hypothetical protein
MGGTIIETESEKWMRKGAAQVIVEMGQEAGWDDAEILERLQKKLNVSLEKATDYLNQYGKVLV